MMEEEVGIKGIRLRRRLSVEAEDVKSPSAQSTPTKKRGGRLAAKPQLELIDENVPEVVPSKTTKARDIAAEEKVLTPSRRSSRIRSNTSIVSETPEVEEKSTPARRTTRAKSNTSLVAEVTSVTTPRAKRAARRNSQIGSDNEAPVTPARQTRRTRKDSTSSVDKTGDKGSQIKEVIVEETENTDKDTKKESPIRKSPRLTEKALSQISTIQPVVHIEKLDLTNNIDKSQTDSKAEQPKAIDEEKPSEKSNLSITSSNLINELDDAPKKRKNDLNKSTNALYDEPLKTRKNRTKSWTTISVEPTNDINFCSDSEVSKKDNKKKNNSHNTSNISGSGDGIMNISNKVNENIDVNSSVLSDKKNKKRQEKSIVMDNETSEHETPIVNASPKLKKPTEVTSASKEDNKEVKSLNTSKRFDSSGTEKLFEQAPAGLIQSLVYIEDSDSNHGSTSKGNTDKDFDSGDQCVPVVDHDLGANETKESTNNLSYEPMDVDETLPENISSSTFAKKDNSIELDDKGTESQKRKSTLNISQIKDSSLLNSKRKSSVSNVVSEDTLDGSPNLSKRKSLEKSTVNDESITRKFKRNSSTFNVSTVDNNECDANKSKSKSLITDNVKDESMDGKSDKSKRKSKSLMVSDDSINKNLSTTSATALVFDENMDKSPNKSKRSSVSGMVSEAIDKRKSSNSDSVIDEDIMNKSLNKSNKKTSILKEVNDNDDTEDKSLSKSRRKSSIVQKTENHDKTDNKSTLVLSQIKDLSQSELNVENNVPKECNESNSQLSKSVNVPNVTLDKESDNKNVSLSYLTSTPLQQKSLKKLGMQINSSIITPSSTTKIEKKNGTRNSTKEASIMSQDDSSDSSEEEDDSEQESSLEKSNMLDDEAEEANANYESGDSRDEDEKEYEEQQEILEKGETLDSEDEDEYSDDDYEKDSFIVSSSEEDNDLLSGSGDDLDMSDNELSMSAKSKMKFNERKSKEQKKASREMFEARHQSDKTGNSKSKKYNRQRLDSTSSESDNEVTAQPKNKRRQKIDSSQEISNVQSDADKSLSKKKIARRMSVSFCDDNEKDKTICEDTESKPNSIRRQRIDSSQDISNVQSDAEKSLSMKMIARRMSVTICEDTESEPKNKSRQNIDTSQGKINVQSQAETSLSIKKIARRKSVSICKDKETDEQEITIHEDAGTDKVDPLALQNVIKVEPKTPQKDFNISTVAVTSVDEAEVVNVDENITILESNQTSDPLQTTTQNDDIGEDDESENSISENEEITENYESMLNNLNKITSNKNKSHDISLNLDKKTKQKMPKEPIVDQLNLTQVKKSKTKQSTAVEDQPNILQKDKSSEKDKQIFVFSEDSSDSIDMRLLFPEDSNDSEAIMVANGTKNEQAKEIKKEENIEVVDDFIPLKRTKGKTNILENTETDKNSMDESVLDVSSNKKKNKRKSAQAVGSEDMNDQETNLNFFIDTTGNLTDRHKTDANTSVKSSTKKNKQKNNVSIINIEEDKLDNNSDDAPVEVSYQSHKNTAQIEEDNTATETPNKSAKKKKKKEFNNSKIEELNLFGKKDNVAEKSNTSIIDGSAKKKKKLSESQVEQETENNTNILIQNVSISSSKQQKQRTVSEICEVVKETKGDEDINNEGTSKKRKRKLSANQTIEEIIIKEDLKLDTSKTLNDSTVNQKKKRKISRNIGVTEKSDIQEIVKRSQDKTEVKNASKKNKLGHQAVNEINDGDTKKNKKRKERDDDNPSIISKVLKQNSFDKVHVPRLPANVLQQLDDKPKTDTLDTKKPKAISTTPFVVEQTKKRRTKPSNYLEQSVYLNDSGEEKRQKGSVKNPKVLPFIPTASTSDYGFTTNFRVNVIPQQTQFVAQSSGTSNFKNDYLSQKRIKKLGTFEKFKRQRSVKLSKF